MLCCKISSAQENPNRVNQLSIDYFQFVDEFGWTDKYFYQKKSPKFDFTLNQNLTTKILRSKVSINDSMRTTQKQIQDNQKFNIETSYNFSPNFSLLLENHSQIISEQLTKSNINSSENYQNETFVGLNYNPTQKIRFSPKASWEFVEQKEEDFNGFVFGSEAELDEFSFNEKHRISILLDGEKGELNARKNTRLKQYGLVSRLTLDSNEDFITNSFSFNFSKSSRDYVTGVDTTIDIASKEEQELSFLNFTTYELTKFAFWRLESAFVQSSNINVDRFSFGGNLSLNFVKGFNEVSFGGEMRLEESEFQNSTFKNRDEIIKLFFSNRFRINPKNTIFSSFSTFKDTYKQLPDGNSDRDELEFLFKVGETYKFSDRSSQTVLFKFSNFTKRFISEDYSINNFTDKIYFFSHELSGENTFLDWYNLLFIQSKQTVYEFENARQSNFSSLNDIPITLERKLGNSSNLKFILTDKLNFISEYKFTFRENSYFNEEKKISQKRTERFENEVTFKLEKSITKSLFFAPFVNIFSIQSDKFLWLDSSDSETDEQNIFSERFTELKIENFGPGLLVNYKFKNFVMDFRGTHYKSTTKRKNPNFPIVLDESGNVQFSSSKVDDFNTEVELRILWNF